MPETMTPREKVARVIAAELSRQDDDPEMTPEKVCFIAGDELCWSYIDQGPFDFGQCADAILTALASGSGDHDRLIERLLATKLQFNMGVRENPLTNPDGPDAVDVLLALLAENAALLAACAKSNDEICQALGKALGYPWFKDDQVNFPGATDENGVCVGDHVAESLADEAARRITEAERKLAEAVEVLSEIAAIEPEPFEGGLDMEAIRACEECRRYEGHPVQHGICNTHRRPIWDREKHESREEKILGYRAKSIARAFLSKGAERG